MNLVSWNVNGIRAITKKDFYESVNSFKWDVLCLQETKAQENQAAEALIPLGELSAFYNSAEKKGYSSTAVLSKLKPERHSNNMGVDEHDNEGRINMCGIW